MNPSQPSDREETIFNEALAIRDPQKRRAFLDAKCGDDQDLRSSVEQLLAAEEEAGDFLAPARSKRSAPLFDTSANTCDPGGQITEKPGTVIGRYKLLQQIGEGGFGVVYMAEQERPVKRRVALKIVKAGLDTKAVIARFEAERQALAMMDHPNIARVLDAGATDTGRPYFVMELVKGIPITEYCDEANLQTKQRLKLFMDVCSAVQHAHQKGVIHRDLKPSNIMITLHDGVPVVKVIDFGIAKATEQKLTEKTLFTAYGQMIGTPTYMSPEQAVMSGLDVDTRSDIYSLGVLLYELLTGGPPFDAQTLRTVGFDEMRRIIREQEPTKPSTKLSTLAAEVKMSVAAHRHASPQILHQQLRGDLDWIVMKALEKDRSRRYETASVFAQDIARHLNCEPVEAAAPTTMYRLRKFVSRNRPMVTAASLLLATIVIGAVLSTAGFFEANRQRKAALSAQQDAEFAQQRTAAALSAVAAAKDELELKLLEVEAAQQAEAEARESAQRGEAIAEAEAERANQLRDLIYNALRAARPAEDRGSEYTVRQMLADLSQRIDQQYANDPAQRASMHWTIAESYQQMALYDEADRHYGSADQAYAQADPSDAVYGQLLTEWAFVKGKVGRDDQSVDHYRSGFALLKSAGAYERSSTPSRLFIYAKALGKLGREAEAEAAYAEAKAMEKRFEGQGLFSARNNRAVYLMSQGNRDQAATILEQLVRDASADDDFDKAGLGTYYQNLGTCYRALERLEEAADAFRTAFELRFVALGFDHQQTKISLRAWSMLLIDRLGRRDEAVRTISRWVREAAAQDGARRLDAFRLATFNPYILWQDAGLISLLQTLEPPKRLSKSDTLAILKLSVRYALNEQQEAHRALPWLDFEAEAAADASVVFERIGKAYLILPTDPSDRAIADHVIQQVRRYVREPSSPYLVPWFALARGMAEYRDGHYTAAIEQLRLAAEESDLDSSRTLARLFVAMALHQSGRTAEARSLLTALNGATTLTTDLDDYDEQSWHDAAACHAAMREARALILSELPPQTPADVAAREGDAASR